MYHPNFTRWFTCLCSNLLMWKQKELSTSERKRAPSPRFMHCSHEGWPTNVCFTPVGHNNELCPWLPCVDCGHLQQEAHTHRPLLTQDSMHSGTPNLHYVGNESSSIGITAALTLGVSFRRPRVLLTDSVGLTPSRPMIHPHITTWGLNYIKTNDCSNPDMESFPHLQLQQR